MASSLQTLLDTGSQMLRSQQFEDAQKVAAVLLQQYPGNPLALLFAADTADALGDRAGALRHVEAVPPGSRTSPRSRFAGRKLLFGLHRRAEARDAACPQRHASRTRRSSPRWRKC